MVFMKKIRSCFWNSVMHFWIRLSHLVENNPFYIIFLRFLHGYTMKFDVIGISKTWCFFPWQFIKFPIAQKKKNRSVNVPNFRRLNDIQNEYFYERIEWPDLWRISIEPSQFTFLNLDHKKTLAKRWIFKEKFIRIIVCGWIIYAECYLINYLVMCRYSVDIENLLVADLRKCRCHFTLEQKRKEKNGKIKLETFRQ